MPRRAQNNPRQLRSKSCGCAACLIEYPGDRKKHRDCSGAWQARYRDPDGKQRARNFEKRAEADAFLDKTRTSVREGSYLDPKRGQMTIGEWYTTCQAAWKKKGRRSTKTRKVSIWETHVRPKWEKWPLVSVGYMDVEEWIQNDVVGYHTQKKALELLRQLMVAAMRDKRIQFNPAVGVELETPEAKHPDDLMPPSREQCALIREHLKEYYRPLMVFAEETGMRWGEYTGLRLCNVDRAAGTVKVKEVLNEDHDGTLFRQPAPKTAAGFRTVPLTPAAVDALAAMIDRWQPSAAESPIVDGELEVAELVFRGPRGGVLSRHNFRRVWLPAIQAAGVARMVVNSETQRREWWPRVHDLRHVFATRLKDANVPEKDVQVIMGHDRGSKVTWLYQHAGSELVEEVRTALVTGHALRIVS